MLLFVVSFFPTPSYLLASSAHIFWIVKRKLLCGFRVIFGLNSLHTNILGIFWIGSVPLLMKHGPSCNLENPYLQTSWRAGSWIRFCSCGPGWAGRTKGRCLPPCPETRPATRRRKVKDTTRCEAAQLWKENNNRGQLGNSVSSNLSFKWIC